MARLYHWKATRWRENGSLYLNFLRLAGSPPRDSLGHVSCRRHAGIGRRRDCGARDREWEVHQEDHCHRDWVQLVRARSEKAAEVAHSVCLAVLRAYEIRDDAVETARKARARTAEASAKACNAGARQVTARGVPRTALSNDAQDDATVLPPQDPESRPDPLEPLQPAEPSLLRAGQRSKRLVRLGPGTTGHNAPG